MTTILGTENPVTPDTSVSCILTITTHILFTSSAFFGLAGQDRDVKDPTVHE